jgi:hypothetical protein
MAMNGRIPGNARGGHRQLAACRAGLLPEAQLRAVRGRLRALSRRLAGLSTRPHRPALPHQDVSYAGLHAHGGLYLKALST